MTASAFADGGDHQATAAPLTFYMSSTSSRFGLVAVLDWLVVIHKCYCLICYQFFYFLRLMAKFERKTLDLILRK